MAQQINKQQNKDLIEKVATIYATQNGKKQMNQRDFDYMRKEHISVMMTEDGLLIPFDKLRIETSFCTGYGYGNDYDEAHKIAEIKRTSQDYFKSSNLEGVEREIKSAKEADKLYLLTQYYFGGVISYVLTDRYFMEYPFDRKKIIREMTPAEKKEYIKHLEFQKENLSKRVDTYLKKYGMSKVRSWTYNSWD